MEVKRAIGVFDWDGTLHRRHVVDQWFRGLITRKYLPSDALDEAKSAHATHLRRETPFDDYASKLVHVLKNRMEGVPDKIARSVGRRIAGREEKHLYVFTRLLLEASISSGVDTAVISGSPVHLVEPFAFAHGVLYVMATTFQVDGRGRFTGEIADDWIIDNGKGRAMDRLAMSANLDLKESFAVGDTQSDVPMLEKVGYPICFNPSRALFDEAKKRHWPIVVERKDVCYIHTWFGHTQKYQLSDTPNPIVPMALRKKFVERFHKHFP